ncbi:MAG: helix-turn-helix domain-containing protein [Microthrixaceae bacterium]|nr:helix-turn-helix domain-containing protein [Microthrixaceae bacterium]
MALVVTAFVSPWGFTVSQFSGSRLRQSRVSSGIRIEALALAVGRSVDTLRQYENGRVDPPASIVSRLADSLGVEVGALFDKRPDVAA